MLHVFVDADACPVKQEVYRVAARLNVEVTLVANSRLRLPADPRFRLQVVKGGYEAADDWIVERVQARDIVVTSDILLAERCLNKGALVLAPNGKRFTEDNIGQAVAIRNLMAEIRDAGERTGGPPPLTRRDRSRFLHQLDEIIQRVRREG